MRRVLRFAVCCVLALLVATPSAAQETGWVINTYEVQFAVQANGDVLVTEDIAVDFGSLRKHGIYRDIPVRDDSSPARDRRIHIQNAHVEAGPGTPDDLLVLDVRNAVRLRIGSPSQTVSGRHRYRLTYRVVGALNSFASHEELYWNVTGSQWEVPIERVTARVTGPAAVTRVACYTGPTGSTTACPEALLEGGEGRYSAGPLQPGEDLTVVAAFPVGSVQVATPSFMPSEPEAVPGGASEGHGDASMRLVLAVSLAVLIGAALVRFVNRQRSEETSALGPLEERPPDGLRPALLSLLIHGAFDHRKVTATLVDLAVRGYLSIEPVPQNGLFGRTDWLLTRRPRREDSGTPPLLDYERKLYEALFASRAGPAEQDSVLLSTLKGRFGPHAVRMRRLLSKAGEAQGWFTQRPDAGRLSRTARTRLLVFASLVLSAVFYVILREHTSLLLLPFMAGGLVLWLLASRRPYLTPAGKAMLRRALGFREFIRTAEAHRARLTRQPERFSECLPYAMAFGDESAWGRAFLELPVLALAEAPQGRWLRGAALLQLSDLVALMALMTSFGASVGPAIASTSVSAFTGSGWSGSGWSGGGSGFGGGGFSGGGGGGGGGGGW